jgi:hypothetical protein
LGPCLGGFWWWGEFHGEVGELFIGSGGRGAVVSRTWARAWSRRGQWLAPVAGRVGGAWAASAGVGVTSVARWSRRVTTNETGSSTTYGSARGQVSVVASPCLTPVMEGGQRGMVREWLVTAESKYSRKGAGIHYCK